MFVAALHLTDGLFVVSRAAKNAGVFLDMATPKSIICQGITYGSVLELAERFGIHPSSVARRLRDGWTPEAAVGVDAKPKRQGHRSSTVRRVSTLISLTFGLKRAPTTGSSAGFDLAV